MTGAETISIVPEVAKDRHGDPVVGAQAPAEIVIKGCITWPRTSTEPGRGDVIIAGLNVFIPGGQKIPAAKDRVRARNIIWEVDGEPGTYLAGGATKGTIVVLKRVGT